MLCPVDVFIPHRLRQLRSASWDNQNTIGGGSRVRDQKLLTVPRGLQAINVQIEVRFAL